MTAKSTTSSSFFQEGYEVPQAPSDYTKLKKGLNKLRILSAPIMGYEYWTEDNKPVRSRELWGVIPLDAKLPWEPKHFWAMIVWNFETETVQIWQPTQKTILNEIYGLVENADWGDPRGYNLNITRKGDGLKTEYTVQPSPHSVITPTIKAAYVGKKINLNALFDGANPFEATESNAAIETGEFKPKIADHEGEFPDDDEINPDDVPF